jgi:hypothetical protein
MSPNPVNTRRIEHLANHSNDLNELLYEVGLKLEEISNIVFKLSDVKESK